MSTDSSGFLRGGIDGQLGDGDDVDQAAPYTAAPLLHLIENHPTLTDTARQRWSNRWKAALTAFEITFGGRLPGRK